MVWSYIRKLKYDNSKEVALKTNNTDGSNRMFEPFGFYENQEPFLFYF